MKIKNKLPKTHKMKKIFFKFMLIVSPIMSYSQSFTWQNDCERIDNYSEWSPEAKSTCTHEWVYAEWGDVNENKLWTNAVYCPCGCGGTDTEARICSICKSHQKRTHIYSYVSVERKSPYQRLTEADITIKSYEQDTIFSGSLITSNELGSLIKSDNQSYKNDVHNVELILDWDINTKILIDNKETQYRVINNWTVEVPMKNGKRYIAIINGSKRCFDIRYIDSDCILKPSCD